MKGGTTTRNVDSINLKRDEGKYAWNQSINDLQLSMKLISRSLNRNNDIDENMIIGITILKNNWDALSHLCIYYVLLNYNSILHFISYLESLEENDYLIFMNKAVESASRTPDASCNVAET